MGLETFELDKVMLSNSIGTFRFNPAYIKMCEAHAKGLGTIQEGIDYMSDLLNVDKANGIWLDYIGALVGIDRTAFDMTQYFCVNLPHINQEKEFYFPKSSIYSKSSLSDIIFRGRIKAKIGYNISKGTREENLYIIKYLTNATEVKLTHAKEYNSDIFTNVGNLTIDDGVVAGFTRGKAIKTTINKTPAKSFRLKCRLLWNEDTSSTTENICVPYVFSYNRYRIDIKKNSIYATSDIDASKGNRFNIKLDEDIPNNAIINIDETITSMERTLKVTINGKEYLGHADFLEEIPLSNISLLTFGNASNDGSSPYLWSGGIDLKEYELFIDDKKMYNGSNTVPMMLNCHLYGDEIIFSNINMLRSDIENVLAVTVGLNDLEIN